MVIYYSIYSLLLIFFFLYKLTPKQQGTLIKFWVVIITLFGGLRWNTGYDWDSYLSIYKELDWSNFLNYSKYGGVSIQTVEPLYAFLNVLVKSVFGKYFYLNIIECFIIHYAYYRFAKYHLPQCPILCFCFLEVVLVAFFPVRQTLAMGILLLGIRFIKERKLLPYLSIVAIAFFIHRMSIVALPLYWLGKIRLNNIFIIAIFFSFIIIGRLLQDYFTLISIAMGGQLGEIASTYTENQTVERNGVPIITILLNIIFLCLYLYYRHKFTLNHDEWFNYCLNSYLLFVGIMVVFSQGMGDMTRLICLFLPGHCLLFSSITAYSLTGKPTLLPKSDTTQISMHDQIPPIIRFFSVTFFILYFSYKIVQCFSDYYFEDACIPYRTIFEYSMLP